MFWRDGFNFSWPITFYACWILQFGKMRLVLNSIINRMRYVKIWPTQGNMAQISAKKSLHRRKWEFPIALCRHIRSTGLWILAIVRWILNAKNGDVACFRVFLVYTHVQCYFLWQWHKLLPGVYKGRKKNNFYVVWSKFSGFLNKIYK